MTRPLFALATLLALAPWPVLAQEPAPPPTTEPVAEESPYDRVEPDFGLVALPTTLRLPRHRLVFRMTHRFTRPFEDGDFGDLAGDLFGLDSSAQVGFEFRFGLTATTQLGLYRTSDKTIQFFLQQELWRSARPAWAVAAQGSLEGQDNFGEEHAPALGLVLSRRLGNRAALYVVPRWVGNTRGENAAGDEDSTLALGFGARLRLGGHSYLVADASPRVAGYEGEGSQTVVGVGLEGGVGGHVFQLNVSTGLGTTPAQLARGEDGPRDWRLGFNLSRKFY